MRKTFSVEKLKTLVNNQILHSADDDVAGRQALILTIESVLQESGNYSGFQYLGTDNMKFSQHGTTVGINDHNADDDWKVKFDGADRTRVKYF